jgi:hypothetical protein
MTGIRGALKWRYCSGGAYKNEPLKDHFGKSPKNSVINKIGT